MLIQPLHFIIINNNACLVKHNKIEIIKGNQNIMKTPVHTTSFKQNELHIIVSFIQNLKYAITHTVRYRCMRNKKYTTEIQSLNVN